MKRRSVSSVLAERIKQRQAVTPGKFTVRHVKFTPEEMAYDPSPEETADWIPVGRGPGAHFAKPSKELLKFWKQQIASKKGYAKIDPDLRKIFKDDQAINAALRSCIVDRTGNREKRRKSA